MAEVGLALYCEKKKDKIMPLKNYTSTFPVSRSIAYIETKLTQNGAKQILKLYDDTQRVTSIFFIIPLNGNDISFKLPARVAECEKVLRANLRPRATSETRKKVTQQAERTAWKILLDWVEAQMAMIELAQVEFLEVFLPYTYNNQTEQTFYDKRTWL